MKHHHGQPRGRGVSASQRRRDPDYPRTLVANLRRESRNSALLRDYVRDVSSKIWEARSRANSTQH